MSPSHLSGVDCPLGYMSPSRLSGVDGPLGHVVLSSLTVHVALHSVAVPRSVARCLSEVNHD